MCLTNRNAFLLGILFFSFTFFARPSFAGTQAFKMQTVREIISNPSLFNQSKSTISPNHSVLNKTVTSFETSTDSTNVKQEEVLKKAQSLCKEYKDFLYVRKIHRFFDQTTPKGELNYGEWNQVIKPRMTQSNQTNGYWHSAAPVGEGLKHGVYQSGFSSGLMISKKAEFALGGTIDLAIPSSAPKNFYEGANKQTMMTNLINSREFLPDLRVTDNKNAFKDLLKKYYQHEARHPYGEAIIHYKPDQITGLYLDRVDQLDPPDTANTKKIAERLKETIQFYSLLLKQGIDLPLLTLNKNGPVFFSNFNQYIESEISPKLCKTEPTSDCNTLSKNDCKDDKGCMVSKIKECLDTWVKFCGNINSFLGIDKHMMDMQILPSLIPHLREYKCEDLGTKK